MRAQRKHFDIKVDAKLALPVYEQVKRALKHAILSGNLPEGERLMSIRELALKLRINPNTIIKVYYQLEVEGFIYSRPGTGYFVKLDPHKVKKEGRKLLKELTDEYISKAMGLGYALDDIKQEISSRAKKNIDLPE